MKPAVPVKSSDDSTHTASSYMESNVWIPPYRAVCDALGVDPAKNPNSSVTVSGALLVLMLKVALQKSGFDEAYYLKENPDIRKARDEGKIGNLSEHFSETGYFEGRSPGQLWVDEDWYKSFYSDIGAAIRAGKIKSAADHYYSTGAAEWRAPNAALLPIVSAWRNVLNPGRK